MSGVIAAAERPLENLTKSASGPSETRVARRAQRWQLHEAVGDLLPGSRAARCGHQVVPDRKPSLRVDPGGHGYFAGVRSCGSVWHCPFCAAKVGRARVAELRSAVAAAQQRGLVVTLATFTVGHKASDSLVSLLDDLTEAMRAWRSGRSWQELAKGVGYVGSVRNLEVTWGEASGWHPHSHALLFTEYGIDEWTAGQLRVRWAEAVARQGGYASAEVGLQLSSRDVDVSGYLSKAERELAETMGEVVLATDERRGWGAAEELVWANVKEGRQAGRYTAWGLLRLLVTTGWVDAADRWVEYAAAFHGRRQLYWSRGLRAALGLGDQATDQELADATGETDEVVVVFEPREWRQLVRDGLRAQLIAVLDGEGVEAARRWVWEWSGRAEAAVAFDSDWWQESDPGAWVES